MPRALAGVLTAAFLIAGCGGLREKDAEKMLREHTAATPVEMSMFAKPYGDDSATASLARLGLIERTLGDWRRMRQGSTTITPAGAALGIKVRDSEWLTGRLCEVAFGSITSRVNEKVGDFSVVRVTYVLRHTGHTPLYEKVKGTRAIEEGACDAAHTFPREAQFVRLKDEWHLNQRPSIPGKFQTEVKYDYDRFGRQTGATNHITIPSPVDPDGDSVTVAWSGREFTGDSLVPMTALQADGLKASFRGMSGAIVYAVARDRFGAVDSARFCFESREFSCRR